MFLNFVVCLLYKESIFNDALFIMYSIVVTKLESHLNPNI